jgi:tetratricopeptide (TPR) repeat protein
MRKLGDVTSAVELAQKAVELWDNLVQLDGPEIWGTELAEAKTKLASSLAEDGQTEAALKQFNQALALLANESKPKSARDHLVLMQILMEQGILCRRAGETSQSIELYMEALAVAEPFAEDAEVQRTRALILENLGNALVDLPDYESAVARFSEAAGICEELFEIGEGDGPEQLAGLHQNRANALLKHGDLQETLVSANRSIELYQQLVAKAGRADLALSMARILSTKGIALEKLFRSEEAVPCHEAAIKLFREATPPAGQYQLAAVTAGLQDRLSRARALLSARPQEAAGWAQQAAAFAHHAETLSHSGDTFHACDFFDEALQIYFQLDRITGDRRFQQAAARLFTSKGLTAMHSCRMRLAEDSFLKAIEWYDRLLNGNVSSELIDAWANAHIGAAGFYQFRGDTEAAQSLVLKMKERLSLINPAALAKWSEQATRLLAQMELSNDAAAADSHN